VLIRDADGPIGAQDEERLSEFIGEDGYVYVERGFQRDDVWPMRILFAGFGFLLLVVTLISTSLSLAEQQSDMGTFAAVGATRDTRRALAAAQAMVVGLIGALLGIAVGLVPGIAITYPLTTVSWDQATGEEIRTDPTTVIPWLPLALVVIGVPLLAGLLSALAVRRAPAMTRRAD
jgi:putative ABC transport system permease protein